MRRAVVPTLLTALLLAAPPAWAARICVEEMSGVCLKYVERPASPAARAEAALGLSRDQRRAIQQALSEGGFYAGQLDGLIGPATRDALRRWQQSLGRPATGYLDSEEVTLLAQPGADAAGAPIDIASFIVGKRFHCQLSRGWRILSFEDGVWTGESPRGTAGGTWTFSDGILERRREKGRFRATGSRVSRAPTRLDDGVLHVGKMTCRQIE